MQQIDTKSRRIRWALFAVATVALAATVVTCKSVTDNVTGTRQTANEAANCVSECAHAANELIRAESQLHVSNIHDCDGNQSCINAENARHTAAVDAIQDFRKRCQANCHHQGSGKGGR